MKKGLDEYKLKLNIICLGGGRINWESKENLKLYGYSKSYGQCDHELSKELILNHLNNKLKITTSNEGY